MLPGMMDLIGKYLTSKRIVTIMAIAALAWGPIGTVLCRGHDGHVAMEFALHSHCEDLHCDDSPPPVTTRLSLENTSHRHCLDSLLSIDCTLNHKDSHSYGKRLVQPVCRDLTFINAASNIELSHAHTPSDRPSLPEHFLLDTVVLRL